MSLQRLWPRHLYPIQNFRSGTKWKDENSAWYPLRIVVSVHSVEDSSSESAFWWAWLVRMWMSCFPPSSHWASVEQADPLRPSSIATTPQTHARFILSMWGKGGSGTFFLSELLMEMIVSSNLISRSYPTLPLELGDKPREVIWCSVIERTNWTRCYSRAFIEGVVFLPTPKSSFQVRAHLSLICGHAM